MIIPTKKKENRTTALLAQRRYPWMAVAEAAAATGSYKRLGEGLTQPDHRLARTALHTHGIRQYRQHSVGTQESGKKAIG